MRHRPAADPLSLQVFANLFASVAEEMGVTLLRTAYSPNITMRRDFSCALFDAEGRLLAQAAHIPVHLGAMPLAMRAVRRRFELVAGDVVVMNDPFEGGTHLPDISLVSAVFAPDGARLGYVMSRAHHADVGGMSPGSMPLSTEIYQEGILIPPSLLATGGQLNETLLELILANVRTPVERRGDFEAQLAAQRIGEERLQSLAERYGAANLTLQGNALQQYSEASMRALIAQIRPGTYCYEDQLDGDGQTDSPVVIRVAVTRSAASTDLRIDFTGTADQCPGAVNAPEAVTTAAALYVLRCFQSEDIPVNEGSLVPLEMVSPPGSVVAARPPAAVSGGNVETSQRIVDTLFGALGKAFPALAPAASQGTMNNLAFGGQDTIRGRPFAYYETMGGGSGARSGLDGMNGVHDHMSNTLNTPIEVLEAEYPVRVTAYRVRRGSGGSGTAVGGNGLVRTLQFLAPVTVTVMSDRRISSPYGIDGGGPGRSGENLIVRAGRSERIGGKVSLRLQPGESLSIASPGGGGWGQLPPRSHG